MRPSLVFLVAVLSRCGTFYYIRQYPVEQKSCIFVRDYLHTGFLTLFLAQCHANHAGASPKGLNRQLGHIH